MVRKQRLLKTIRTGILLIALLGILQYVQAQTDTLYYDAKWKPSIKDSASFFRPPPIKEGDFYRVKDFYISGELQMNGRSKHYSKDTWEGQVIWYNQDGSIFQQGEYSNGRLDGDFITFFKGEKLLANYKYGKLSSGKQNLRYKGNTQYLTEKKNDTTVEIVHDGDLSGIRFERYSSAKEYDFIVRYFDNSGEFLGQRYKMPNGNFDGIEVLYYYNPLRIKTVNYFKVGRQFASSSYYPNGKPRALFKEKPDLTKTFYDAAGNTISEMSYTTDQYGLKPYQGTLVNFKYTYEDKAYLKSSKKSYDAGKIIEDIIYYDNQKIKTKTIFKPAGQKHLQIGFDNTGNEISRMEYKNYLPFNGIELLTDRATEYKEGKLVEERVYYARTKDVFSIKTIEEERYYDKEGKLLGTLKFDLKADYEKPWKGIRYYQDYNGGISSFEQYEDGFIIERTSFRSRVVDDNNKKKTFKTIEVYQPESYDKIKEINHYSNGQVQAIKRFKKYLEQLGTFYDKQGNLLGKYDYENKEGVRYKFFNDSDKIQEIEEVKEGKRIRFKKYTYGRNSTYGAIDPLLIEDFDINCCESHFNQDGQLIAQVSFKDGKPWSGSLYDPKTFEKYILKEGKREGLYQKLDYNMNPLVEGKYVNGMRNGTFTTYNNLGRIMSVERYQNNELNGLSEYYNDEGGLVGKMKYNQGLPMSGTRTVFQNYGAPLMTESYENGKLVAKIELSNEGKRVTTFQPDNISETIVFYPDSDIKRLTFSSKNRVLDGMVIRYDKRGEILDKAQVKNGRLISGSICLAPSRDDGNTKYSKLTKGEETIKIKIYGDQDKVLFTAEEHLYFGSTTYYLQKLDIQLDYLNAQNLY